MSWLYTIIFAGLMFSSENNLPEINNNFTDSNVQAIVQQDETERFEQTYPLNANGKVSVSNVNGSITVETWDRAEVKLEYVKTADTKENLAEVEIRINARKDAFSVETDYDDLNRRNSAGRKNFGKLQVEYRLLVPRNALLDQIATVNGSVNITGAGNMTKASSVNGVVRATNLRGAADLETVNGTVEADFNKLQAGSRISLNTVNGTVSLTIPSDANATVKADTLNGNITNDFGLPVRKGEYVGRDLYGRIGSGDVQIRLNSVNGALSVKRKNDGRNVNPATNLLNLKRAADDEDWDDENNSNVKPPKPPKPPKSPKPPAPPANGELDGEAINKAIKEGLKQAEKEIEKIGPEFEKQYAEAIKQAKNLNSEEMQAQIRQAREKYREAMTRMFEANWTVGSPNIETKNESFNVKGTPKLTVEAGNCDVSVRGWDKSEVRYSITRVSKNRTQIPLDFKATQNGSDVNIKFTASDGAANGGFFDEMNRVRIEVFVPKKSNLKIVTSGEIRLEGVSGDIDMQGADDAINVRDSDGKLQISAADGRLRIVGFRGELDAKTTHGVMNLDGDFQKLSARTIDGTIVLILPENANVNIESNRKDIVGEGISLDYQGDGRSTALWKVGNGGANHLLYTTADGRVIVRAASLIKTN